MPPPTEAEALELLRLNMDEDAGEMFSDIFLRELEGRSYEYTMNMYLSMNILAFNHFHRLEDCKGRVQSIIADFVTAPTVTHRLADWGAAPAVTDASLDFNQECPICFDDRPDVQLPCGHKICQACEQRTVARAVDQLETPKCGICRAAFEFTINLI